MTDLTQFEQEILAAIDSASDEAALENVRLTTLGKSGSITTIARMLGKLPPEERRARGIVINKIKDRVAEAIASRRDKLKARRISAELQDSDFVSYTNVTVVHWPDVTLPVREPPTEIGRIHPISQVVDELTAIFADMEFAIS